MPSRRQVIVTAAVGGAGGVLAGCLGDDDDGTEEYDTAVELLEENSEELAVVADSDEVPDSFDKEEVIERAERAEEHLTNAEDAADDDELEALIENAQAAADHQRAVARYNGYRAEFDACFETIDSLIDAERWDDAQDEFGECTDVFSDLKRELDEVESTLAAVDPELLEEDGAFELSTAQADIEEEQRLVAALETFFEGFDEYLGGVPTMLDALEAFENERWQRAEADFEDARTAFAASESTFSRLEDDPETPAEIRPDVIDLQCIADAFYTAADHFVAASAAAQRGDWETANERAEEGGEALEAC